MVSPEFTRFPNLSSAVISPDEELRYHELAIAKPKLPEEILLLCWAQLLSLYTGFEEVAFLFNDRLVQVRVEDLSIQRHERFRGPLEGYRNATGVFKKDVRTKHAYGIRSNSTLTWQSQSHRLQ